MPTPQPEVEFLILADRAEIHDGKLYLMGGGWDQLTVPDFANPTALAVALGVSMPWAAGGIEHPLRIRLETEQGAAIPPEITGTVCLRQPPDPALMGRPMRVVLVGAGAWVLPRASTYRVVATVGDGPAAAATFRAVLPQTQGVGKWQA